MTYQFTDNTAGHTLETLGDGGNVAEVAYVDFFHVAVIEQHRSHDE